VTEHLRRDPSLNPEQSRTADPNVPLPERSAVNDPNSRPVANDPNSRPLVTPPPTDVRSSNVASGPSTVPSTGPSSGTATGTAVARAEEGRAALFAANEATELRARWDSIQVGFVDEPRKAVQEADALVSDTKSSPTSARASNTNGAATRMFLPKIFAWRCEDTAHFSRGSSRSEPSSEPSLFNSV
jgi:hypothetical protein